MFKDNGKRDKSLRWQYFGSSSGLMRLYPAREWDTNFAGFYNDYDPRVRNWYIAATSGPKDVVIVIDCSLSMKGACGLKSPIFIEISLIFNICNYRKKIRYCKISS